MKDNQFVTVSIGLHPVVNADWIVHFLFLLRDTFLNTKGTKVFHKGHKELNTMCNLADISIPFNQVKLDRIFICNYHVYNVLWEFFWS